ncbi:hypothetical protein FVEN_g12504 [Fusarium venenatum]|uniref:Ribosomal protein YmL11, mitochondrial n=1 Tax=Fusarium venenatum TaxID=56646 RepID=A0A2L2TZN2_9HYPO|nr:uncharacterized protein FVRRES_03247 [Fusarium venenatum]KAG8349280.1 hypothetical protein FVEN_g12504 [Fusarium venenatum]KAH7003713.1 hypothetical protein EDB82DRAFT_29254 [Fusarium venenatum]CEI66735.1 unnamed protein product [Fusarium venenatum]
MASRISRAVSPCLRQFRRESQCTQTTLSTAFRSISTSPNCSAAVSDIRKPIDQAPATKPPSARPVETRKSQLIRTYTSLLRTTPLILFFQHSNLTAVEWAAVRRELKKALSSVPQPNSIPGKESIDITPLVQLQVVRTNMLRVALKLVEFYDPGAAAASDKTTRTARGPLVHDLSAAAYDAIKNAEVPEDSNYAQIEPVMVGPLAALVLPAVSPAHVSAALSVLAPVPGKFPAPSRKKNPGYHDPTCQSGLAKLLLVGGRVEGKIFDQSGINWVGGIEGGLDGLRAQLVAMLQGAGLGITSTLEGGSRSLWLALEGRKGQLEDEAKGDQKNGDQN